MTNTGANFIRIDLFGYCLTGQDVRSSSRQSGNGFHSSGFAYDLGMPTGEVSSRAKAAAAKAFEIDDTLAEAQTSLAYPKLLFDWDFEQAESFFRRALELNSNYANARHWYAHLLKALSRFDEALVEGECALELDPLNALMNTHLGWHFMYTREYDLAIAQFNRTFTLGFGVCSRAVVSGTCVRAGWTILRG